MGIISFGRNDRQGARIFAISNGTWTEGSAHPTDLVFQTVPNSSTTLTTQAKILKGGEFQFNSGYGSAATAYGVRAWVSFDGTGTLSIRGSGGVSSVTDVNTGVYDVNFSNTFPDTNYAVTTGFRRVATDDEFVNVGFSNTTTSFRVEFFANGSVTDTANLQLAIFR